MNASKVYEAARTYAAEGLPVIPLPSGQKFPPPKGWQRLATTDEPTFRQWFNGSSNALLGEQTPNIGIVTGRPLRDGRRLLVLDVDPRNGGDNSLTNLEGEHGPLMTRTARTPSGGLHLLFGAPASIKVKNSVSKLRKGLDIRGEGGYVAAAPSTTEMGAYTWDDADAEIADAPEWLLKLATEPRPKNEAPKNEAPEMAAAARDEVRTHNLTLQDAGEMLKYLCAHVDNYQPWAEVLWCLRRMARGVQDDSTERDWLALADEWSRTSKKYSGWQDVETKWLEADGRPGFGARHLIELAKAGGWKPTAEQEQRIGGWVAPASDFAPIENTTPDLLPAKKVRAPLKLVAPPDDLLIRVLPERDFAICPYLPRGTVSLLLSMGGLGKSHVLLLLAVCKALGLALPDTEIEAPTPGRAVVLSAEDDLLEMQRRLQRILKELDRRDIRLDMQLLQRNLQMVDMSGGGADNWLIRAGREGTAPTDLVEHIAREVGNAEIIAIDTLSRCNGGEENSNGDAATLVSACETIARQTGAAVLVLAHVGKAVAREGVVDMYTARGASAYADNARSVMVLAAPSAETRAKFAIDDEAIERGDIFRLHHAKANYARKAADLHFARQDNGVVMPTSLTPKEAPSEDAQLLQLLNWAGKEEVRRNQVRDNFRKIFGNDVTQVQALETFDRATARKQLVSTRKYNGAEYFRADLSMKVTADSPLGQSMEALV